jgi:hypothetical protein
MWRVGFGCEGRGHPLRIKLLRWCLGGFSAEVADFFWFICGEDVVKCVVNVEKKTAVVWRLKSTPWIPDFFRAGGETEPEATRERIVL